MEIRVVEKLGPVCVDPADGGALCGLSHEALARGESVCLDFTGVTTLASAFLNAAVGCLYASFGHEDLSRRLSWKGLYATDESIMRFVQKNAIRFYSANAEKRGVLSASSIRATDS